MQAQIQALLVAQEGVVVSRIEVSIEVTKLQLFDRVAGKMSEFIIACNRMRIREEVVEEYIQWISSYMQRELADVWKENILDDLESENLEYKIVEEFLVDLKKEI